MLVNPKRLRVNMIQVKRSKTVTLPPSYVGGSGFSSTTYVGLAIC